MNLSEANVILRRAIVSAYFEPELMKRNYKRSDIKHPNIEGEGVTLNDHLHLFFDLQTGCDYPDGDEWFIVEYILPYNIKLPDSLKGPDYFTTLAVDENNSYWRHRELIRYRYGKSKRLEEAVDFIDRKYRELSDMLNEHSLLNGPESSS